MKSKERLILAKLATKLVSRFAAAVAQSLSISRFTFEHRGGLPSFVKHFTDASAPYFYIAKILLVAVLVCQMTVGVFADAPGIINYQGKLTDTDGNPLTGTYSMVIRIYDDPTAGSALFNASGTAVWIPVVNGVFNVQIGSNTTIGAIPASVFQGGMERYLGVAVGADPEMRPRERLLSAPYALSVASASVGSNEIIDGSVGAADINTTSLDSRYVTLGTVQTITSAKTFGDSVTFSTAVTFTGLAADPANVDGSLYYNSGSKKLRLYNGAWVDIATGVGGSASNADLLDNVDSTQFLRSDQTDQYTAGTLTFNSGTTVNFAAGSDVNVSTDLAVSGTLYPTTVGGFTLAGTVAGSGQSINNLGTLGVNTIGGGTAGGVVSFSTVVAMRSLLTDPADSDVGRIYYNSGSNRLRLFDGTAWVDIATGTAGSNADTLDGLDSAAFLRSDADDQYTAGTLTFNSGTTVNFAAGSDVNVSTSLAVGDNLSVAGNLKVDGTGTHSIAGTLAPTNVSGFTLQGTIAGNNQNISNIAELGVNQINSPAASLPVSFSTVVAMHGLSADPTSSGIGRLYYNTATSKLKLYNGTGWVDLATGTITGAGAASDVVCTNCVDSTDVSFNYATSNAKGGPAISLVCDGCVNPTDIAPGSNNRLLTTNAGSVDWVAMSGDATMTGAGALTIADGAISGGAGGKLTDDSVTAADLAADSVTDSELFNGGTWNLTSGLTLAGGQLTVSSHAIVSGNLTVSGAGTHSIGGTLAPTNVAAHTLTGDITASGAGVDITGLSSIEVDTIKAATAGNSVAISTSVTLTGLVGDPASEEGRLYFNSGTDKLRYYTGTEWVSIATGTTFGGDATTLDGLDSLQFLRSDASDNYTSGTLTFDNATNLTLASGASFNAAAGSDVNISTDLAVSGGVIVGNMASAPQGTTGKLYYDTATQKLRLYNGTWVDISTGSVAGSANDLTCTNCVDLGSETVGPYVSSAVAGNYIGVTFSGSEGSTMTISNLGVTDVTDASLSRSGSGPYTLGINVANANTWTGVQAFNNGITASSATLTGLAGDPTNAAGRIYYNSSTNKLRLYNGSAWVDIATGSVGGISTDLTCTNCVELGAETVGLYVSSVAAISPIGVSTVGSADGSTVTVSILPDGIDGAQLADTITLDAALQLNGFGVIINGGNLSLTGANALTTDTDDVDVSTHLAVTGAVTVGSLASDPTNAAGKIYYNSGSNKLRLYNGTTWVDIATGSVGGVSTDLNCINCVELGAESVGPYVSSAVAGSYIGVTFSGSEGSTMTISNLGVTDATDASLSRSGSGPYTLGINLANANTWTLPQAFSGGITASSATLTGLAGDPTSAEGRLYFNSTTDKLRYYTGSAWVDIATGTTFGGDAQTLDGFDSTQFLRSDASDSYTSGTLTFENATTLTIAAGSTLNAAAGSDVNISTDLWVNGNLTVNGAGTHTIGGVLDPNDVAAFRLTGAVTGNNQDITGLGTVAATTVKGDTLSPNTAGSSVAISTSVTLTGLAGDPGNVAGRLYYNSGSNKLRLYAGSAWVDIATGSVSGNDADTVDTLHGYQFLRSDTSDQFESGTLTFNSGAALTIDSNATLTAAAGSNVTISTDMAVTGPIVIGGDTNLYRSAADTLKTDDSLNVAGTLRADTIAANTTGNAVAFSTSIAVSGALTLTPQAAVPSTAEGKIYYNDSTDKLRYYTGSTWVDVATGTTFGGDAQTLDGIDSLQFLRSDTSDVFTNGTLTIGDGTATDSLAFNGTGAYLSLPTAALTTAGQVRYNGGVMEYQDASAARTLMTLETAQSVSGLKTFNSNISLTGANALTTDTDDVDVSTHLAVAGAVRVGNLASDPFAEEGKIYYNTGTDKLRLYIGAGWVDVATGSVAGSAADLACTDCVELGRETVGPYMSSAVAGGYIGVSWAGGSEGSTMTITNLGVTNATDNTLTRSGAGPYTLGINLANANTWTAAQTLSNANLNLNGSAALTTTDQAQVTVSTHIAVSGAVTVGNLASAPTAATGKLYYNTGTGKLQLYNGAWVDIATGTAGAGATDLSCADCVELGAETVGLYVSSVVAASPISVATSGSVDGSTVTIGILADSINGTQLADSITVDGTGLNFDSNTLFINPSTNRVGIGNAAPSNALHVTGGALITSSATIQGGVLLNGGTVVGANTIDFGAGTNDDLTDVDVATLTYGGATSAHTHTGLTPGAHAATHADGGVTDTFESMTLDMQALKTNNVQRIDSSGNLSSIGTISLTGAISDTDSDVTINDGLAVSAADVGLTFSGTGNHLVSASAGTLQIGTATLTGNITGNSKDITGVATLGANNVNVNTLAPNTAGGTVSISTSVTFTGGLTVDPSNAEGRLYYNTSTDKLRLYNGTAWVDIATGAVGGVSNDVSCPSCVSLGTETDGAYVSSITATSPLQVSFAGYPEGSTATVTIMADGINGAQLADIIALDAPLTVTGSSVTIASHTTIGGNLQVMGTGTHSIAGTLDPNIVAGFQLSASIDANGQDITALDELKLTTLSPRTAGDSINISTSITFLPGLAANPAGVDGRVYYNSTTDKLMLYANATLGWVEIATGTTGGGAGIPGGSNTQIQYNNGGAFGGATGFTWNETTRAMSLDSLAGTSGNVMTVSTGGVTMVEIRGTGEIIGKRLQLNSGAPSKITNNAGDINIEPVGSNVNVSKNLTVASGQNVGFEGAGGNSYMSYNAAGPYLSVYVDGVEVARFRP